VGVPEGLNIQRQRFPHDISQSQHGLVSRMMLIVEWIATVHICLSNSEISTPGDSGSGADLPKSYESRLDNSFLRRNFCELAFENNVPGALISLSYKRHDHNIPSSYEYSP
jgi:hypothetical protein